MIASLLLAQEETKSRTQTLARTKMGPPAVGFWKALPIHTWVAVRMETVEALGNIKDPRASEASTVALNDREQAVRNTAKRTFEKAK